MKSACFVLLAGVLSAQVASVGVKTDNPPLEEHSVPHAQKNSQAAAPVAGYLPGPGQLEIHSILTLLKSVKMGESVPAPLTAKRLYLPPRQQYALVEQSSGDPVGLWSMRTPDVAAISGAMAHPDSVVFSPRGDALLLYSQASSSLQVVTHLPAEPVISRSVPVTFAAFESLAVSDDGQEIVALLADGSMLHSANGAHWTTLHTAYTAQAMSFISKTHHLAIVDSAQKLAVQLSNIDSTSGIGYRVLAQDVQADRLFATRGGEQLLGANRAGGEIWTIDLKSGSLARQQEPGQISQLLCLRDGYTFLVSNARGLSLVRLAELSH